MSELKIHFSTLAQAVDYTSFTKVISTVYNSSEINSSQLRLFYVYLTLTLTLILWVRTGIDIVVN
jgi:hypothetical protein